MTILAMPALNKMSLVELEELAAKLRDTIARNPASSTLSVSQPRGSQWIVTIARYTSHQ